MTKKVVIATTHTKHMQPFLSAAIYIKKHWEARVGEAKCFSKTPASVIGSVARQSILYNKKSVIIKNNSFFLFMIVDCLLLCKLSSA
jgi:hypothetical protein